MKRQALAWALCWGLCSGVASAEDTLTKIQNSGQVTEGVRESSGLSYTLGNGVYTGFHYDVCAQIIDDIKQQLNLPQLRVVYQPVTSQNRIPLVQNGTVDLECGSTTNNRARQRDVAFAITTYVEETKILVRSDSGLQSLKDLAGKIGATTTGTTSVQTLRKQERAVGLDFKAVFGKDHADSFLLLETGRADAFVMDASILAALVAKSKNPNQYRLLEDVLAVEPIAIMLRKDDLRFKQLVDESIRRQIASGGLNRLWTKWFLQPIPPLGITVGLPLSHATQVAWEHPNDSPTEDYRTP